ncbi:hypothetical protein K1719_018009 [Acacia pycnantha]|nr:hypothetical protein K1719_018009 [Acacia pycnantha]
MRCCCPVVFDLAIISPSLIVLNSHLRSRSLSKSLRKKNVLIVIAHPDDESMFFTPTINYLTSRGHYIHILCLSIGDADSKGSTRKRELFQACATLKVPMQQVKVVDHSDLQDGFGKVWNHMLVANLVKEEIDNYNIDMMITFDNYGVSGHCNHRDVHYRVWLVNKRVRVDKIGNQKVHCNQVFELIRIEPFISAPFFCLPQFFSLSYSYSIRKGFMKFDLSLCANSNVELFALLLTLHPANDNKTHFQIALLTLLFCGTKDYIFLAYIQVTKPNAHGKLIFYIVDYFLFEYSDLIMFKSSCEVDVWVTVIEVSTNILHKYSGPIDVWLSMFDAMLHSNETIKFLVNEHPNKSFLAMAQHSS